MIQPENLVMINFDTKVLGVYMEMNGKGYHVLRMSDFELLEYTGLKDKNEREIYDGDIIDGSWINPMSKEKVIRHYRVTFNKGKYNAELIGHHPYGSTMLYFENEKAEIMGNIYDNSELLEV